MRTIAVALFALGWTVSNSVGFNSVALATHGGDHCTLEQHAALIAKGYNNKQEAAICDGRGLQSGENCRTDGEMILDGIFGTPPPRGTFCETQYGQCATNIGKVGEGCSCTGRDGQRYAGFVKGIC